MSLQLNSGNGFDADKSDHFSPQERSVRHLIEWREPPSLSLNDHGLILDINPLCEKLFGYQREGLVNHHVSKLFAQLSNIGLIKDGQFNPALTYLCRCGHFFHAQNQKGELFPCNLNFVCTGNAERRYFKMIVHPHGG